MMFQNIKEKMISCIMQGSENYNIANKDELAKRCMDAFDIIINSASNNMMDSGLSDIEEFGFEFEPLSSGTYFTIKIGMYICVADVSGQGKRMFDLIESADKYRLYLDKTISEDKEIVNIIRMDFLFNCGGK